MLFSSYATTAVLRSFLVKVCCWIPWCRRSHQGVACCREELPVTCGNLSCWIILHLLGDITTIAIHILANKIARAKSSSKEQNSKREPWRQGKADIFSTIQQTNARFTAIQVWFRLTEQTEQEHQKSISEDYRRQEKQQDREGDSLIGRQRRSVKKSRFLDMSTMILKAWEQDNLMKERPNYSFQLLNLLENEQATQIFWSLNFISRKEQILVTSNITDWVECSYCQWTILRRRHWRRFWNLLGHIFFLVLSLLQDLCSSPLFNNYLVAQKVRLICPR